VTSPVDRAAMVSSVSSNEISSILISIKFGTFGDLINVINY
jgi:hypothetical protein